MWYVYLYAYINTEDNCRNFIDSLPNFDKIGSSNYSSRVLELRLVIYISRKANRAESLKNTALRKK